MAKKRFTDDMLGLFEEEVEVSVPVSTPSAKKKLSSKSLTQNLDAFLSESFEQEESPASTPKKKRRVPRRRTGLDYLIRSTVSEDRDNRSQGGNTAETKRVTLIFNKEHLTLLKEQAKERKMYLKDVVQEMVASYLDED